MTTYSTTVTKTGQIFLPKAVRTALNLLPGQRISFDVKGDVLTLRRAKTIEEILADIDRIRENASEETKRRIKMNAGKTVAEMRDEWDRSPEGQKYYKEKYGV